MNKTTDNQLDRLKELQADRKQALIIAGRVAEMKAADSVDSKEVADLEKQLKAMQGRSKQRGCFR